MTSRPESDAKCVQFNYSIRRRDIREAVIALDYDGSVARGDVLEPAVREAIALARTQGIVVLFRHQEKCHIRDVAARNRDLEIAVD